MKAARGQLPGALDRPDPAIRFYLFHGPDAAGSRAHAIRLLKGLGNAEKFIVLGNAVKVDPASLADEAGAMALFGGPRAIWIEPATDEICEGVAALLDAPASESAVIALAGELRKSSDLLKLAEGHGGALAHCSYLPEGRDMERVVMELGQAAGLRMLPEVANRVAAAAGNNQAIAEQELGKFALFLGAGPDRPAELDHATVDLLGADSGDGDWMRLGDLAMAGRMNELVDGLARLPHGGDAIPALRSLQRRLLMLAPLRARIEGGERLDGVMTSMGKALFWKDKPLVQRLLGLWFSDRLAAAADRVGRLERQLMLESVEADAALGELLVTIARAARAR